MAERAPAHRRERPHTAVLAVKHCLSGAHQVCRIFNLATGADAGSKGI